MFIIIELSSQMSDELREELDARLVGEEEFTAPNPRYSEYRGWYRISFLDEVRYGQTGSGQRVVMKRGSRKYVWETSGAHISPGGYGWPSGSLKRL